MKDGQPVYAGVYDDLNVNALPGESTAMKASNIPGVLQKMFSGEGPGWLQTMTVRGELRLNGTMPERWRVSLPVSSTSKQEDNPELNIIHRLESGMFPALFFLTSASVLAQPLIIPPGHWQEGMAVGVTEFRSLFRILCKCLFSEVTVQTVTELDNKAAHCHSPVLQRHRSFLERRLDCQPHHFFQRVVCREH